MSYRKFESAETVAFVPADDEKKIYELIALGWRESRPTLSAADGLPAGVYCECPSCRYLFTAQQSVQRKSACCGGECLSGIRKGEPDLCSVCGGTFR